MKWVIWPTAGYIDSKVNAGYTLKRTIMITKEYIGTNKSFRSLSSTDFFGALAYK